MLLKVSPKTPFVLLDDRLTDGGRARLYRDPADHIICDDPADIPAALARIDAAVAAGHHVAGFCAYELGYALEPKLRPLMPMDRSGPLMWFGLFRAPQSLDDRGVAQFLTQSMISGHRLEDPTPAVTWETYEQDLRRIHDWIRAGDVYQINYTFPLRFSVHGDPLSLYAALRARQRVRHGALINTGSSHILSLSPELFFESDGTVLRTRPMKGTVRRGQGTREDVALAAWLRADPKSRAENLMIVDLLRNDVGRLGQIGSVRVPHLFTVETYPTLHTLTSTVEARLDGTPNPARMLKALFPCGSVTGAPKIRAMEIIRVLEKTPRGVYTGAVGVFDPEGETRFNVGIRTMTVDAHGVAQMGVGGGIVADSEVQAEYEECFLKARFLTDEAKAFSLIETLAWRRDTGIPLLAGHEARLSRSAAWFGFPYQPGTLRDRIRALIPALEAETVGTIRLRVLLSQTGDLTITRTPLAEDPWEKPLHMVISHRRIDAADPFYSHKTTRRDLYDAEFERVTERREVDEVLFLNQWGEVAEGSRTTLFVERAGVLLTPPLSSGALPGVMRGHLLGDPTRTVREEALTEEDLWAADRLYLANAVRGLCPARLIQDPEQANSANSQYPPDRSPRQA